ncbi:hypothetical protein [Marinobacterium aestuariivivens]|uniref:Transglycosylase SLT domain-containing protein n=1 Tax=Marinobacterium aestuariivivens TaxID=1698799 RepID=A0ABW1ZX50_9GAMM
MASTLKPALCLTAPLWLGGCAVLTSTDKAGETPATCRLLEERGGLRLALQDARANWSLPPELGLALLEPPPGRAKQRHVLPYGNAWDEYRIATRNWSAQSSDLADAVDFLGWNAERNRRLLKLDWHQTEAFYLAYRLGPGAYSQGVHRGIWLEKEAGRVAGRARGYAADLAQCPELVQPSRWEWQRLWRWF